MHLRQTHKRISIYLCCSCFDCVRPYTLHSALNSRVSYDTQIFHLTTFLFPLFFWFCSACRSVLSPDVGFVYYFVFSVCCFVAVDLLYGMTNNDFSENFTINFVITSSSSSSSGMRRKKRAEIMRHNIFCIFERKNNVRQQQPNQQQKSQVKE